MHTLEISVTLPEQYQEMLIAELADLDFEAFEQDGELLRAYIPSSRWDDVKREHVTRWLHAVAGGANLSERVHEPENWNARWEQTIGPMPVGRFLIKPTWTELPEEHRDRILLEIDPKMSFGTGYHESTRLVLNMLPGVVRKGDYLLDAGTGTGILAIAAIKLGARGGFSFDIDEWAQMNAVENYLLNGVHDQMRFEGGSLEVVPDEQYDLILANIHRSVLIEMMPSFAAHAHRGTRIVLAGLLKTDRDRITSELSKTGFTITDESEEGEWWACVAARSQE
jgi:ribosomal protein L11 methyltransferase